MVWKNYQVCPSSCFCFIFRIFQAVACRKGCRKKGTKDQSFVPIFAQFNQKALRISWFLQHQVQQPEDKLSMWQAGDSQTLLPCKSGCFRTIVTLLSHSFISAGPAYSEATTWLCCYMIRNFARPNPLDNKTIYLKILDHKHFICSKSTSMIPYLTVWNKE